MSETIVAGRETVLEVPERIAGIEVPRVLGRVEAAELGPTLIVVGGMHGNEPAGVKALQRILARLESDPVGLDRGRLVGLTGNRKALAAKRRYLVNDLNRYWLPGRVARLRASTGPLDGEDEELRDLNREIERQLFEARETVYLLDLHTTSGPELPFATHDDTLRNRPFAFAFPVPVVLGLEEELVGTLSSYVGTLGVVTAGFESGQHDAEAAVDRAEAAIWIALEASGVLLKDNHPEVEAARHRLARECKGLPRVVEVRHRHAITPDDSYRMKPGYENFQAVAAGEPIGRDGRGPVVSPFSGLILMPLYQKQGADGFFIVQRVARMWLEASAVVRRWRLERLLPLLPGVRRHPDLPDSFVVDRRYARWLAREFFHLLGYKRLGDASRVLIMSRRLHDRSQ
ncbi:MAG: aspartoacylase [bacterium]|nr:aspartoacylase [bacterium]